MDYLLSRENTSSKRSNPLLTRSVLVNRNSVLTIYISLSSEQSEQKDKISDLKHELDV